MTKIKFLSEFGISAQKGIGIDLLLRAVSEILAGSLVSEQYALLQSKPV